MSWTRFQILGHWKWCWQEMCWQEMVSLLMLQWQEVILLPLYWSAVTGSSVLAELALALLDLREVAFWNSEITIYKNSSCKSNTGSYTPNRALTVWYVSHILHLYINSRLFIWVILLLPANHAYETWQRQRHNGLLDYCGTTAYFIRWQHEHDVAQHL